MPSATPPGPRIPAWQRLGLKLKSAPPEPLSESPYEIESAKRKRIDTIETPTKKAKKASNTLLLSISNEPPITPQLARKKSVTFTPETKVEDGDSIKQLFTAWVAEQRSQDPTFALSTSNPVFKTPEPPKVEEEVDTTLNERERRVKRVKKPKEKTDQNEDITKSKILKSKSSKVAKVSKPPTTPSRPFLSYLKQYHESRDSWKFNKNHQNHLLKHVFDAEVVPSNYAHFIYIYVRGLQGGVRTRLRDAALAIKVKDQEEGAAGFPGNMADGDKRQREYDAAMNEYVASMISTNASSKMGYEEGVLLGLSDAAMAPRVVKRMRAEKILAELGTSEGEASEPEGVNGDNDSQKRLRINDGSSQKLVRKRKQRTTVVDDDTSSSGDSSDSESSSDDDSEPIKRHAQAQVDTSSSSSSSSSSGSEDGDEDEDDEDEDEDDDDDEEEDNEGSDSD